jgi:hypothetical protein
MAGVDILVVGRAVSKDVGDTVDEFPGQVNRDEIERGRVMTEF